MWLFGLQKKTTWDIASDQIAEVFLDLRKEFFKRCIEALDWNIFRGIIQTTSIHKDLSGYAELSTIAFQMWTVRAVSEEGNYIKTKDQEMFYHNLGSRVCGENNEMNQQLIIREVFKFHELYTDPELQHFRLASSLAAHFYPESDTDRELAIKLIAKIVPSFHLRLYEAVARSFGDTKTAKKVRADINKIRTAGAGY